MEVKVHFIKVTTNNFASRNYDNTRNASGN